MTPHIYNLAGIRDVVFSQLDWAPATSPEAKRRLNMFIQQAYNQLATEAPFCFFQAEDRYAIEPDVSPASATDTLEVANGDQWVLQTSLSVGNALAAVWEADKDWSGRYLQLTVPNSDPAEKHLVRIREVWQEDISGGGDYRVRISLERPWRNTSDTGIVWKVVTDEFLLPDNLIVMNSMSVIDPSYSRTYEIEVKSQSVFEAAGLANPTDDVYTGNPTAVYRQEHQSLRGPTFTPTVAADSGSWSGSEPQGKFQYLVTYAWGKQESWTHSPGPHNQTTKSSNPDRYAPYMESAPSAESAVVTTTGNAVTLTTPNLDFMLGFDDGGTERYHKTGIVKRIYRKRITSGTGSTIVETPDTYFFLDEIPGFQTSYTDDGSITPDYHQPYRAVHGYQSFRIHPRPNRRIEVLVRYIERPAPLTDDNDVPRLHEDALPALIERVKAMVYEQQGNAAYERMSMQKYERALMNLKKRYASLAPSSQVVKRRPAGTTRRRYRKVRGRNIPPYSIT